MRLTCLLHIDGWEKTGRYDEEAIMNSIAGIGKRNQIARDADALYEQLYARYQAYVDEHPVHKQQAGRYCCRYGKSQYVG